MHLVMFDIDGTLVNTSSFEDDCFALAITSVLDMDVNRNWESFGHVSDTGIINELISDVKDNAIRQSIFQSIRLKFTELVAKHLSANAAPEIPGAARFFEYLRRREDVVLSIATGGWRQTAEMKLESAGINYPDIALASSDDHFDRQEIMKIAQRRSGEEVFTSRTYIGDGAWDKTASNALGFNFILVGNKTSHSNQIDDYSDVDIVKSCIGL